MTAPHQATVFRLAREQGGLLRAKDAIKAGATYATLSRMVKRGELIRVARGIYELPGADISEHHTLAEAAARVPHGAVCLLSALAFHEMTTQLPFDVWMAYERGKNPPRVDAPRSGSSESRRMHSPGDYGSTRLMA